MNMLFFPCLNVFGNMQLTSLSMRIMHKSRIISLNRSLFFPDDFDIIWKDGNVFLLIYKLQCKLGIWSLKFEGNR